jgi:hypothetical protein
MGLRGIAAVGMTAAVFVAITSAAVGVALLANVRVSYLAYAIWVGSVIALLPRAFPPDERLKLGAWAVIAAFIFAALAAAWVIWLAVTRARWVPVEQRAFVR